MILAVTGITGHTGSYFLQELISQIPPEDRASEAQVRQRLEACRGCGHLRRGTCGLCGCYVEHRAEKKGASCPSLPSRWS